MDVGMGVGSFVGVVSMVSAGDAEGSGTFGESAGVEIGSGAVTVALSTGLRLWLLLIATQSAVMSIRTLVVAPSWISKWMIISILPEGTFKSIPSGSSWKVAVASLTCKRIFE